MNTLHTAHEGVRARWNHLVCYLQTHISDSFLSLVIRLAVAVLFLLSGRTKVEGFLDITPSTYDLFRNEYHVPLISPELAAHLATYAERLFPMLLIVGLFTRLSAIALLTMTAVIQFFVYPDAWPTHLSWAGLLLFLIGRGAGVMSLDKRLGLR